MSRTSQVWQSNPSKCPNENNKEKASRANFLSKVLQVVLAAISVPQTIELKMPIPYNKLWSRNKLVAIYKSVFIAKIDPERRVLQRLQCPHQSNNSVNLHRPYSSLTPFDRIFSLICCTLPIDSIEAYKQSSVRA
jgi:hypothetical protein